MFFDIFCHFCNRKTPPQLKLKKGQSYNKKSLDHSIKPKIIHQFVQQNYYNLTKQSFLSQKAMRDFNGQDYFLGDKDKNTHQSSNLAKYGKMNMDLAPFQPASSVNLKYGDNLSLFQDELERMANKAQFRAQKKYLQRKKRAYTQSSFHDKESEEQSTGRTHNLDRKLQTIKKSSTKHLQDQIEQIRQMVEQQRKVSTLEERFQRLYNELQKKNSQQLPQQNYMPQSYMPPPPYYPPPYYPPYDYDRRSSYKSRRKPSDDLDSDYDRKSRSLHPSSRKPSTSSNLMLKSTTRPLVIDKNKYKSLLKKYFYAVTFISFLKKQSRKLALARRNNLRKFWQQKFTSQVSNMKNWLLQTMKYSISIILQKKQLNFNFLDEKRQKVRKEKEKLVLQLVFLTVKQMKKLATPKDVSLFSEVLAMVCRNGNFPISRFWTINQIEKLRISQYFGFVRAEQSTEKFMLLVFVFMKVLIFNMLLQPYKFDSTNFKKNSEPLLSNMYLVGSVLYQIIREVVDQYLSAQKEDMYEPGNWLKVKKQFICECCQPHLFNTDVKQQGQYISGMIEKESFFPMLQDQANQLKWNQIKQLVSDVIDQLYKEMKAKSKMLKGNLKYKMYN